MNESTIELIRELQQVAKHTSPQGRAKLDLPLLTALSQQSEHNGSVGESIDAAVAEAASHPEFAPLATLFPPSSELWANNLSGRQRQAAAQVGLSYDSFRRRRNGRPSPYDELCEALLEQLRRSLPAAALPPEPVVSDLVSVDLTDAESPSHRLVATGPAQPGQTSTAVIARSTSRVVVGGDMPHVTVDGDVARPKWSEDGRLRSLVVAAGLLLVVLVGAQQLRASSPDPAVTAIPESVAATTSTESTTGTTSTESATETSTEPPEATISNNLGLLTGLVARPGDESIVLSWIPAVDGQAPDGFDIARDGVGFWSLDDPNAVTFADDRIEPGQTYSYAVTPWLANASDDPADRTYGPTTGMIEVTATLALNSLHQPLDLVAMSTAAGMRLEWQPAIGGVEPEGFDIARDGVGYWSLDGASIRMFVDELVEPGQIYSYAVTPWLANGSDDPADRTYGPTSAEAKATFEG